MRIAKACLGISAAVALLVATSGECYALMSIELVSVDRAKALGLEVRAHAAGPDVVRVELEFETQGKLKDYSRVDLELRDGGRLLSSSTLREEPSKPGRIVVGFAADRTKLDQMTLRVVVQHSPRSRTGYDVRVKDFVDLEKVR